MALVADQSEVVSFLTRRFAGNGAPPRVVTTHASMVFLTRERAFKLKRAVRFAFLDFSTPERRLALCEREVTLNRRWAPGLYLAARRLTREADGRLALDGAGELVDALVEMRRFPDADLLEARVAAGDVTPALMTGLARRLAALHAAAPPERDRSGGDHANAERGGAAALARVLALDDAALRAAGVFAGAEIDALTGALAAAHARLAPLLDARRDAGKVRRCHADLILRNICVLDGEAIPFDALEFDEDLGTIDVLYDLAFLLMDVWRAGRADLANLVFNRYLDAADETDGLALMPFFVAVRASVRAHVTAAQAREAGPEGAAALAAQARAYFDLARACLAPVAPRLVAVGGLSGSGKSTLAAALAPALGPIPGARVLSSDRLRKAMHGVSAETRLPPEAYRPEVSRRVYATQREAAARALAAGSAVVVDAVFDRPDARAAIEAVAREAGARFDGLWLDAPLSTLGDRVEARRHDASDATRAVLEAQAEGDVGAMGWTRLDAAAPPERLAGVARRILAPE